MSNRFRENQFLDIRDQSNALRGNPALSNTILKHFLEDMILFVWLSAWLGMVGMFRWPRILQELVILSDALLNQKCLRGGRQFLV